MSQNLRIELKGTRIRVTEIFPDRVATNFFNIAVNDPKKSVKAFEDFEALTSEDISGAIMYAVDAPWRVNIVTIELSPTKQTFSAWKLTLLQSNQLITALGWYHITNIQVSFLVGTKVR